MFKGNYRTDARFVTKKLAILGAALLAGLFTAQVQAFAALDLVPDDPDIFSGFIQVDYV